MGAQPKTRSKGIVSWPEEERPRERLLSAVFVDIYGNEARELIPAERFGMANGTGAAKRRTGAAR